MNKAVLVNTLEWIETEISGAETKLASTKSYQVQLECRERLAELKRRRESCVKELENLLMT